MYTRAVFVTNDDTQRMVTGVFVELSEEARREKWSLRKVAIKYSGCCAAVVESRANALYRLRDS